MSTLSPYLPHQSGETPASFIGRLAIFHCVPNPRLLCRMIGLDFRQVVHGDPDELAKLGRIAGVPAIGLRDAAVRRGPSGWTLRGQQVSQPHIGLRRICPRCLAEDVARSRQPAHVAAFERSLWTLGPIQSCPDHHVRLIEVGHPSAGAFALEFSRPIQAVLEDIASLLDQTTHQVPSDLEQYLVQRLINPAATPCWLDRLEWWAAVETCQVLGTLALFGRSRYKNRLLPDDLYRAGAAGFDIARQGAKCILSFFHTEHRKNKSFSRADYHSANVLGTLHHWMVRRREQPAFEPICEVFREYLVTIRPYATGALVLGRPLTERRYHTIHSLAADFKMYYRTVEEQLVLHGILSREAIKHDGRHVLIAAQEAEAVISRYRASLTLGEATALLGLGQRQGIRIAQEGLLEPIASRTQDGRTQPTYDRLAVEALRERLLGGARPVSARDGTMVTIDTATRVTGISTYDLIRHILDGKFQTLRVDPSRAGVQGLLLSKREVMRLLRRDVSSRLTRRQAAKRLHVEAYAVTRLLEQGLLRHRERPDGKPALRNGSGVDRDSVAAFQDLYISASALAKRYGVIHTQIIVGLRVLGIPTCFDPIGVEAYFYDRRACLRRIEQERSQPMAEAVLAAACRANSKNARTAVKAVQIVQRLREAFRASDCRDRLAG